MALDGFDVFMSRKEGAKVRYELGMRESGDWKAVLRTLCFQKVQTSWIFLDCIKASVYSSRILDRDARKLVVVQTLNVVIIDDA